MLLADESCYFFLVPLLICMGARALWEVPTLQEDVGINQGSPNSRAYGLDLASTLPPHTDKLLPFHRRCSQRPQLQPQGSPWLLLCRTLCLSHAGMAGPGICSAQGPVGAAVEHPRAEQQKPFTLEMLFAGPAISSLVS